MMFPNSFEKARRIGDVPIWLFSDVQSFLTFYEERDFPLPIDYFEELFLCLPDDICELFDFDFIQFYDYILKKEKNHES